MNIEDAIMRHSFADVADEYLCHHGIKGQKWGIRRFQNPDGTLTEEGKARYYTDKGELTEEGSKAYNKESKRLSKYEAGTNRGIQARKFALGSAINAAAGLASQAVVPAMLNPSTVLPAAGAYGVLKGAQIVGAAKALSGFTKLDPIGHNMAVKKYEHQKERMNNMFGETKPNISNNDKKDKPKNSMTKGEAAKKIAKGTALTILGGPAAYQYMRGVSTVNDSVQKAIEELQEERKRKGLSPLK